MNRLGPKIDHWGTPFQMLNQLKIVYIDNKCYRQSLFPLFEYVQLDKMRTIIGLCRSCFA